jgi:tetratricopeptide (TPR) repeat protein
MLLRVDTEKDGWARLEADFTEEGPLEAVDDGDEEASPLLEGWVLMDGRDLGLPRQLQKRAGEKVPPQEEPRRSDDERRSRSQTKLMAHVARGDDCSLGALLSEAKVSDEVASQLAEAGVDDFEALITTVSRGDHHQELRRCGIGKLGARAKLATLVQPYWKALAIKEQGNTSYKQSRFEEAARMYTRAIELVTGTSSTAAAAVDISDASSSSSAATTTTRSSSSAGGGPSAGSRAAKAAASTDLALNLYSNRAACFQQMREPKLALADVRHVLTFDPSNAKALARKTVYEGQLAAET